MIYPPPEYISQRIERLEQQIEEDEALLRIAYLAIDKMLPTAFCDEGAEALKQLKERLK